MCFGVLVCYVLLALVPTGYHSIVSLELPWLQSMAFGIVYAAAGSERSNAFRSYKSRDTVVAHVIMVYSTVGVGC
jgi:hypothetical protein